MTALAARARSSDASFAGEAGVFTFATAGAEGAFLATGAEAFLAAGAGFLSAGAAFLTGEAAATALATPAAAAVRLEPGRLEGVEEAFLAGVGAFLAGVDAFLAGDWDVGRGFGGGEEREKELWKRWRRRR